MFELLRDEIKQGCQDCPWKDRKSRTVPSEGPGDSPLMVIGRNPGSTEDAKGRPFIGPAGRCLDRFFMDSGISRASVYITNTAKCYGGAGDPCPTNEVFDCCESFLLREIDALKPKLIVPFGLDAYRRVTGDVSPISVIQGHVTEFRHRLGQTYFPMTHPSLWVRTPNYYERIVLQKIVPEFRDTLRDLGILDSLT